MKNASTRNESPAKTVETAVKPDVTAVESAYFDDLVTSEGDFNPFTDQGWQTIAHRFEKWIAPKQPLDILDVGCGTGQSRQIYIAHARRYTGIDLSSEAVAIARRKYPDSEWLRADACELPFEDNSFDVVAFSSVLHHIPNYGDALREAYRVLRPEGTAFAFDPNLLHPAMALFRYPKSPLYLSQGVSPNEAPLHPAALRHHFAAASLRNIRQRGQSHIPYRAVAPRLLNTFLNAYNAADWMWECAGLGRWFGTFIITAGQK